VYLDPRGNTGPRDKYCFTELEIVIDTEVIPKQSTKERSEKEKLEEYQKLLDEGKAGILGIGKGFHQLVKVRV
jgi:hypothetical protein